MPQSPANKVSNMLTLWKKNRGNHFTTCYDHTDFLESAFSNDFTKTSPAAKAKTNLDLLQRFQHSHSQNPPHKRPVHDGTWEISTKICLGEWKRTIEHWERQQNLAPHAEVTPFEIKHKVGWSKIERNWIEKTQCVTFRLQQLARHGFKTDLHTKPAWLR